MRAETNHSRGSVIPNKSLYKIRGHGGAYLDRPTAEKTARALGVSADDVYVRDVGKAITDEDDARLMAELIDELLKPETP